MGGIAKIARREKSLAGFFESEENERGLEAVRFISSL